MDDSKRIEELEKQLQNAKAENERLSQEMKFKDKTTGLWNRKYLEQILSEAPCTDSDYTIICFDIEGLDAINEKMGVDTGDEILSQLASGLQESFGPESKCCKLAGVKMAVIITVGLQELEDQIKNFFEKIKSLKETYKQIEVNYGLARVEDHPDISGDVLLKEADYSLQMNKLIEQGDDDAVAALKKMSGQDDKITILMIDDSLVNLRSVQVMLKDDYKILMTTSGMEGYEIAKNKNPDLILLDYNMPGVDGERILYLLKKNNQTKDIPVVFVSGVSDKEKILKVASMKPAGYLLKPVEKDNLMNVIHSVLNE